MELSHQGLRTRFLLPAILSLCAAAVGTPAFAADDVVSLASPGPDAAASTAPDAGDVDPEQAFLDYTQCMRDHGIDMEDPTFSVQGDATIIGGGTSGSTDGWGSASPMDDPAYRDADAACGAILRAGMPPVDPEQQAELQAQLLEFAQCMREQGVDMPDPQFLDDGSVTVQIGEDGVDPTAADFQVAQQACASAQGAGGTASTEDTGSTAP